ncbi:MAG: amidohydrolase family protein [Planctomycetes bacterium]|nr:amidohydrolase family protein [Planctomycetota bacterium]
MDSIAKIDLHAHLWRGENQLHDLVTAARKLNYRKMCLSGTGAGHGQVGNDAVFEAAAAYPELILPFAWFDLDASSAGEVDGYAERGARGLKVIDPLLPYNHPNYLPVYRRAGELGLPVLFHSGLKARLYDGVPSANVNHRPVYIDDVARRCPGTMIVMAHIGTPWHEEALMTLRLNPNVYMDLSSGSGWAVKGMDGEYFKKAMWWKNAWEKIVFSSDVVPGRLEWAADVYGGILEGIGADEDTRRNVFHRNAEKLWPEAERA